MYIHITYLVLLQGRIAYTVIVKDCYIPFTLEKSKPRVYQYYLKQGT